MTTLAPKAPASQGAGAPRPQDKRSLLRRVLGPQPFGLLLGSPYLLFVLAVFAFPVGYSVYIAFHDFFFAAPGVQVERPFVGFDNFVTAFSSPQVIRSFGNIGIFLVINVPLTVVLSLLLASALVLGVVAPAVLGFTVCRIFFFDDWQQPVFIGATLCATSVGITARVLKDLGRSRDKESRIILGAAVIDDVLGLIALAVAAGVITASNRPGGGGELPWGDMVAIVAWACVRPAR